MKKLILISICLTVGAITVHAITTTRSAFSYSFSMPHLDSLRIPDMSDFKYFKADTLLFPNGIGVFKNTPRKIVYVIDGKVSEDGNAFRSISPLSIASITVLKNLPGVKVEADGSITVNGQPVKIITINGRSYSVSAE